MSKVKIVERGVGILALNVSYADKQFQPIEQELNASKWNLRNFFASREEESTF